MPKIDLFYYGDTTPGQSPAQLYRDIEEQVILGDKLGYNGVWVTEPHFRSRGEIPDPLLFLTRLSGVTSQIRLGTSIVCAPYYHPVRLAESALLLDTLSGGRLDLGVGTGMALSEIGEVFGFESEDASARAAEIHEILRQAFDDGVINFQGKFYNYSDVELSPRPGRPAKDVIWTAAGRNAVRLAAERGYRLMIPRPLPLEDRLQYNADYRKAVPRGEVIHLRSGLVAPTTDVARQRAVEFLRAYSKTYLRHEFTGGPDSPEFDVLADKLSFAVGTPDDVAEKIRSWTDQFDGTEQTAIQFQGPYVAHEHVLESIELFASVLPELHVDATDTAVAYRDPGPADRVSESSSTPFITS